jgi:hypothetical protein
MSIADVTESALLALIFNATAWANYADNAATTPQTNIAVACTLPTRATPAPCRHRKRRTPAMPAHRWRARAAGGLSAELRRRKPFPRRRSRLLQGTGGSGTVTNFSTGKTGGGAAAILFSGTVTPNIVTGNGVTPQLSTATTITLD